MCEISTGVFYFHLVFIYFQEETVRLRKNVAKLLPTAQGSSDSVQTQPTSVNLPPMAIVYLVLAMIFGIIIGKFIL